MILRLFEQARIVPDNPFAFSPSMEVRLQISVTKVREQEKFCTGMYLYCDRMEAKEQ